jgi:hypothetical protein
MTNDAPKRAWEEDYGSEEEFLHAHGFSRYRAIEGEDLWQYGRRPSMPETGEVEEANVYTRRQAFALIAKRMDRND